MLLINLVCLFLGFIFFPLLTNSLTALYFVRSGWYSSGLKSFLLLYQISSIPMFGRKPFPKRFVRRSALSWCLLFGR
ncbi:hypothetical protein EDC94DRAFT_596496 [Helicostylum pulchrum]|nr:hypothetical protein EDC94DRAFT_596496 [Helicostylum pulchrum]